MVSTEWRRAFELGYAAGLHVAIRDLGRDLRVSKIYEQLGIPEPSRDEDLAAKKIVADLTMRAAQVGKK